MAIRRKPTPWNSSADMKILESTVTRITCGSAHAATL
jgi:hypothetical protein